MSDKATQLLVVDDNRMQRIKLSRALEGHGYSVATADGGETAMATLHAQPIDLVLLDIVMPGMDGYQVLQAMQEDAAMREIPVIVVSAFDDESSVARCMEMGAADCLPKSFDTEALTNRVKACLDRRADSGDTT